MISMHLGSSTYASFPTADVWNLVVALQISS